RSATSPSLVLDADHPELLLELPDDLDEHVLRREVELAELVHPLADPVRDVCEPCRELVDEHSILDRAGRDGRDLAPCREGGGLAVRREADRDGPLGDGVGELAPAVDELVQLEVQGPEERADDVPVQLLADEAEVDQLDEGRLELAADLLAP